MRQPPANKTAEPIRPKRKPPTDKIEATPPTIYTPKYPMTDTAIVVCLLFGVVQSWRGRERQQKANAASFVSHSAVAAPPSPHCTADKMLPNKLLAQKFINRCNFSNLSRREPVA